MELILPVEVITDVLSRLPVIELMQCKSVSKSWRAIIDDPTFVDNYTLQHEEEGFLFYTINYRCDNQRFHYGEYNYKDTSFILCELINHHDFTNKPIVVGSCKGLICLRSQNTSIMCIYNPFTGEYSMNLPTLRDTSHDLHECVASGFGYHPITKQYKVVVIVFNRFESSEHVVYVHTLGSNQWRSKGTTRCSLCCVKPRGTQVNGALYWMNIMTEIISFDLAAEELWMVPSPRQLKTHLQPGYNCSDLELGVLGGSLCMIEPNYSFQCSYIYVMNSKDYSWTKKSCLQWAGPYNNVYKNTKNTDYIFKKLSGKLKPVALSIHGKIWLHCVDPGTVEFYDVKTKLLHLIKILKEDMQWPKYTEIIPFTKSYVSLKTLFGNEDGRNKEAVSDRN